MLTVQIGDRTGVEPSEVAAGLGALLLTAGAMEAGIRAYRINLGWHVSPAIPVTELPAESSVAFAPLARLAARERELAGHLTALPDPVAADTWMRAAAAARALRAHARRITATEPMPAAKGTDDGLALLVLRLREGVSAYERLTDTAAELASTWVRHGSTPAHAEFRLADATEALVGMIRGLPS